MALVTDSLYAGTVQDQRRRSISLVSSRYQMYRHRQKMQRLRNIVFVRSTEFVPKPFLRHKAKRIACHSLFFVRLRLIKFCTFQKFSLPLSRLGCTILSTFTHSYILHLTLSPHSSTPFIGIFWNLLPVIVSLFFFMSRAFFKIEARHLDL